MGRYILIDVIDILSKDDEKKLIGALKSQNLIFTRATKKVVRIEVKGGCVTNVENLPVGFDYEVIDHDNN